MYFVDDEHYARSLQNQLNTVQSFKQESERKEKENVNPIDPKLEYIDPTPSIHDLFVKFNKKFFWGALGMVEVNWSKRMTRCAGICYFEGGKGLCKISLSAPLLSLRPRKDLVETLLHEMIHAYLFVTHNFFDREDHGPQFHKHMHRINKEAGTNITVYHTFHDEVLYYQRHVWRCNGPCQNKKPYFGLCQRTMNRAPGPSDKWWSKHQENCGGTFIKISEPERKPKKSAKTKAPTVKTFKDIRDFLNIGKSIKASSSTIKTQKKVGGNVKKPGLMTINDLKMDQNAGGVNGNKVSGTVLVTSIVNTRQVHSKNENSKDKSKSPLEKYFLKKTKSSESTNIKSHNESTSSTNGNILSKCPKISGSSHIGRNDSSVKNVKEVVRNVWVNKFPSNAANVEKPSPKKSKIQCPVCDEGFSESEIEGHVEECLEKNHLGEENSGHSDEEEEEEEEEGGTEIKQCPVCNYKILKSEMNDHLEKCLNCSFINENHEESESEVLCQSVPCPCCFKWFLESEMNNHIDDCLTISALKEEMLAS